jgi:AraC-like DNA-binding protein
MGSPAFVARRCAIPRVHAVEARSDRSFARHMHDDYGIGVITAGAQRSWSGRGWVEAGRTDVITVNPGEVHDGESIGTDRAWSMLYIDPAFIAEIADDVREGAGGDVEFDSPVLTDRRATSRFCAAYTAIAGDFRDSERASENLTLLIGGLLTRRPSEPGAHPSVVRIKSRIDQDPTGQHSLEQLAQEMGLSRFQTLRAFKAQTGLTPHAYLVQRRLDMARQLLGSGTKLADTAAACGFADQSHFSRAFVQRYGLTPRAYAAAVG